ncbi:Broad-complex core protein isoforms 1/2/3/4/5 [Anthophora plagiata]
MNCENKGGFDGMKTLLLSLTNNQPAVVKAAVLEKGTRSLMISRLLEINVHTRPSKEPICNICKRVYSSLNSLRNHKSIYHRQHSKNEQQRKEMEQMREREREQREHTDRVNSQQQQQQQPQQQHQDQQQQQQQQQQQPRLG